MTNYKNNSQENPERIALINNLNNTFEKLSNLDFVLTQHAKILDFGCGSGRVVCALREMGYDSYGYDILDYREDEAKNDEHFAFFQGTSAPSHTGEHDIDFNEFSLPYEDDSFDVILSFTVFEHLMNHEAVIKEFRRILKPNGISINTFPPKYIFIEPHILVPLGHLIKNKYYYFLWALLGIKNQFQNELSNKSIASINYKYATTGLNYLSNKELKCIGLKYFNEVIIDINLYPGLPTHTRWEKLVSFLYKKLNVVRWIRNNCAKMTWVIFYNKK